MLKAVHFGAGNIGRGFIGEILYKNEFKVTFADVDQGLVDHINKNGKYEIEYADEAGTRVVIDHVSALNSKIDEEALRERILEADLITTAIGMANLEKIAKLLVRSLVQRGKSGRAIDLIANENAINATDQLKALIQSNASEDEWEIINNHTGFVNSAIDRQALAKSENGISIPLVEPYYEIVIEKNQSKNLTLLEAMKEIILVDDLKPYIERKLYIVNAGHAIAAYIGHLFDKKTVQDALADKRIRAFVKDVMTGNARYLHHEYHIENGDLEKFIDKTIERHSNPFVQDDVTRVARSPLRKLGPSERIVGPLIKVHALDLDVERNAMCVAAVLNYRNDRDPEAVEMEHQLNVHGCADFLAKHCRITDPKLVQEICILMKKIETNKEVILGGV